MYFSPSIHSLHRIIFVCSGRKRKWVFGINDTPQSFANAENAGSGHIFLVLCEAEQDKDWDDQQGV